MKRYKFLDKTPLELTEEELLELTNQITMIEYNRKPDIKKLQDSEDGAQDLLCYAYEKSAKGKIGINEIKQKPMKYFTNILHLEARNGINYIIRKKKSQRFIYNTLSLDQDTGLAENKSYKTLIETISDDNYSDKLEYNLDMEMILNKIDDTKDKYITINYGVGKNNVSKFSFRNLTKLYLYLFEGKKLTYKNFEGFLYNSKTNKQLELHEIKLVIDKYKNYIKKERILEGGLI